MNPMTYQDYLAAPDKAAFCREAARRWRTSRFFRDALTADAYFRGENPTVHGKTILQAGKVVTRDADGMKRTRLQAKDVIGNRISGGFFYRFVCQQNQYLLQNGCQTDAACRTRLGPDFEQALQHLGERALVQGVAWGFWNGDHLEVLEAASGPLSGFVPLQDEMTGELKAGVRFWQISPEKPLYLLVLAEHGAEGWRCGRGGTMERVEALCRENAWMRLPVFPLWANPEHQSELKPTIREKIDAYDRILSDYADNLDRTNDVYWVLNNFGGTSEDIAQMLGEIARVRAVANYSDGSGSASTAEPHTIEVPYAARKTALEILERELYRDYMALDESVLQGGSLTNVAIRAAMAQLDLKADRYEWQVLGFLRGLLGWLGLQPQSIRFQRQTIANVLETVQAIQLCRDDLDRATALRLNPLTQSEEAEALAERAEKEAGT